MTHIITSETQLSICSLKTYGLLMETTLFWIWHWSLVKAL